MKLEHTQKLTLLPGRHKRVQAGHPWIYSNEIVMNEEARRIPAGSVVTIFTADGAAIGTAMFNPAPLISARMLSRQPDALVDKSFIETRIVSALKMRQQFFAKPYYRLIHAEADGLPGLIIDRYDDTLVLQANTAGMDRLQTQIVEALEAVLQPKRIIARNDSSARLAEGLGQGTSIIKGLQADELQIEENGVKFMIKPITGQKTGWFFDHRDNRAFMASLAKGKRVLDAYTYAGGFALQCAAAGAAEVVALDSSQAALDMAAKSAQINGVNSRCRFVCADAFEELERLNRAGERFDVVIADPPAFAKAKKDVGAASRAYTKLTRLAAGITAAEGYMLIASCSHNVDAALFAELVAKGLSAAGRSGRIIRSSGAGIDHPIHPFLPESAYLKAIVVQIQ